MQLAEKHIVALMFPAIDVSTFTFVSGVVRKLLRVFAILSDYHFV